MFIPRFFTDTFAALPPAGGLTWRRTQATWRALGGPASAELSTGLDEPAAFSSLLALLGRPLVLDDAAGEPAWWGWISTVELAEGGLRTAWSLDRLANRVRTLYTVNTGERLFTPWAEDLRSQARFGVREALVRAQGPGEEAALAARDAALATRAWPAPAMAMAQPAEHPQVTLRARGWWARLDSLLADVPTGAPLSDTAEQAAGLALAAGGDFFSAAFVHDLSGRLTDPQRDGTRSTLAEVEDLLALGTADGADLVAWVDARRDLHIARADGSALAGRLREDGVACWENGRPLAPSVRLAGRRMLPPESAYATLAGQAKGGGLLVQEARSDGETLHVTLAG